MTVGDRAVVAPTVGRPPLIRWRRVGVDSQAGMVTVEAAISLSVLVMCVVTGLFAIGALVAGVRCVDAAREIARLAARGEADRAPAVLAAIGPRGADYTLDIRDEGITVRVTHDVTGGLIPVSRVEAVAFALAEPTVVGAG